MQKMKKRRLAAHMALVADGDTTFLGVPAEHVMAGFVAHIAYYRHGTDLPAARPGLIFSPPRLTGTWSAASLSDSR